MAMLTEDMKRVGREQRLGYVATVCPDGTPNLSPKGQLRGGTMSTWFLPMFAPRDDCESQTESCHRDQCG